MNGKRRRNSWGSPKNKLSDCFRWELPLRNSTACMRAMAAKKRQRLARGVSSTSSRPKAKSSAGPSKTECTPPTPLEERMYGKKTARLKLSRQICFSELMAAEIRARAERGFRSIEDEIRSEEHTSELQSPDHLVCRLLLEKKKKTLHIECVIYESCAVAA